MQNENIALQAKVFLYHLNNSNDENGIRNPECWTIRQVGENGKKEIERNYFPTVSTKVDPAAMQLFSQSVISNLKAQPKLKVTELLIDALPGADYLVAFPPSRVRR